MADTSVAERHPRWAETSKASEQITQQQLGTTNIAGFMEKNRLKCLK
jgi:hypothetical protein